MLLGLNIHNSVMETHSSRDSWREELVSVRVIKFTVLAHITGSSAWEARSLSSLPKEIQTLVSVEVP